MVDQFRAYGRNLPHWELPGEVYFITFRTSDDEILSDEEKAVTLSSLKFHAGKLYTLYACVVMSNHVHIILQPEEMSEGTYHSLTRIIHSIKSYSANGIQGLGQKTGNIWQNGNYDRIIRTDSDFLEKMNYLIYNPVKAGMVANPEDYQWLYFQGMD